jgi:chromosome segregation ATPase
LGTGSADAVNKSSTSWASGGRRAKLMQEQKDKDRKQRAQLKQERHKLQNLRKEMSVENENTKRTEWYKQALAELTRELRDAEDKLDKLGKGVESEKGMVDVAEVLKNEFWDKRPRLSLLITGREGIEKKLAGRRPDTPHRDQSLEYYACLDKDKTRDLFGRPFVSVLKVLPR